LTEEDLQEIVTRPGVKIERIVSRGHRSPKGYWYDQAFDEWVLLLKGSAALEMEGESTLVRLQPGDHLMIAAHTRHRVVWTDEGQDTIWLTVHIHSLTNL
jgi:cupin 2 domain-containing protein